MSGFRNDALVLKTRKEHRCSWCRQQIEKGAQMVTTRWAFDDGTPGGDKFHPECWKAERFWWKANPEAHEMYHWGEEGKMARGCPMEPSEGCAMLKHFLPAALTRAEVQLPFKEVEAAWPFDEIENPVHQKS